VAQVPALLISGLLLWEVLFRGQLAFALAFLEELYSRNLGHLFVSPLRPLELIASMIALSFLKTCIAVGAAAALAIALYAASVFDLGLALLAFFANLLVTGWAVGLMVAALVLRYGLAAENLAWGVIFVIAPISAIYYPVSVLPGWLQNVSWCLPSSYVFEGMRGVLLESVFKWDLLFGAIALNAVYVAAGVAIFFAAFRGARLRGALLQMGE
jgi:ABC-2 type transport system permease protein